MNINTEVIQKIEEKHEIIESYKGKVITRGSRTGEIKNPYWHVINKETQEEYYIMLCNDAILTYISKESIKDVIDFKYSWNYNKNIGYIFSNGIYLHSYIMKHKGCGKGGKSIDHINRKRLDNRLSNLRITECGENTSNQQKKSRSREACKLPDALGNIKLPKYVEYCHEYYSFKDLRKSLKYKDLSDEELKNIRILRRDFFTVHNNPLQPLDEKNRRYWCSTKSMSVSIVEKYNDVIKYLESIGYDYHAELVDVKEMHREFFIDIDEDFIESKKKPTKRMKEELEKNIETDNIKKRCIQLEKSKIIEILTWKLKILNKEKLEDDSNITRTYVSNYYKEKEDLDISTNQIHRIWNKIILNETDFENEDFEIDYPTYTRIISIRLRQLL
jgi:hypothetical protein